MFLYHSSILNFAAFLISSKKTNQFALHYAPLYKLLIGVCSYHVLHNLFEIPSAFTSELAHVPLSIERKQHPSKIFLDTFEVQSWLATFLSVSIQISWAVK